MRLKKINRRVISVCRCQRKKADDKICGCEQKTLKYMQTYRRIPGNSRQKILITHDASGEHAAAV